MPETFALAALLLPELEMELARTRKMLEHLPDGHNDFKSADRSMPLNRLAGHTAELAGLATIILTHPGLDMGTPSDPRRILRMETREKLLEIYAELASEALAAMRRASDSTLEQSWVAARKGEPVFTGTRYWAYRNMCLNHMVHHRAQLGVYLRLLGLPVPSIFGPSADQAA